MRTALTLMVWILAATRPLAAQQPMAAGGTAEAPPAPPADYRYEPDGRRDPFLSLVNRGVDARPAQASDTRPEGVAGVLVDELDLRGLLQSRGGWIAMIAAPDGRSYTVRTGDRLMDGVVRAITPQALVIMQDVKDPLSLEKQREVRKYLRGEVK